MRCSNCGSENPAGKRFCGDCASPLDSARAISAPQRSGALSGERRYLTVLFADLVNSTAIATRLDPEEWRELIAEYHRVVAEAVERFGGYVAQYQGDGVMAYFGWPEAHDNNAERAARAGLSIVAAVPKLGHQRPTRPKLSARVGIDSGAVVVGGSAGKNADVFGETPNIANRVQAAAASGTVLITGNTHALLVGLFEVEDRGTQALKGIDRPIQLYRLVQPSGMRGRLDVQRASRALTPFVGRDDELRLVLSTWEEALEGKGRAVLISGEPGIGKSRLLQQFRQQIAGRPSNWVESGTAPFFQNTPFYLLPELLRQLGAHYPDLARPATMAPPGQGRTSTGLTSVAGSNGHSGSGGLQKKHEQQVGPADLALTLTPGLVAAFIQTMPGQDASSMLGSLDRRQRRLLLSSIVEWIITAAYQVPLVIALEDLHWADPSTLELIELLAKECARAPLLLLFTARREFCGSWPSAEHLAQITLNPLDITGARTLVQRVAKQTSVPEEIITLHGPAALCMIGS